MDVNMGEKQNQIYSASVGNPNTNKNAILDLSLESLPSKVDGFRVAT